MLEVRSDEFSEKQLAEIALAIQKRWEVPAFVKMHHIVIVDEDVEDRARKELTTHFERGIETILQNLDLSKAVRLQRTSKNKYKLERIPGSSLPRWTNDIETTNRVPEGVFECPHCIPPSTIVLGDNKAIVEYKIGDTAIGSNGLNAVLRTYNRTYKGQMITINANGLLPIVTTPEHPILVSTSHSSRLSKGGRLLRKVSFSTQKYLAAKDLVAKHSLSDGNYLVVPIIKGTFKEDRISLESFIKKRKPKHLGYGEFLPLNCDTAWLIGLYVAEGSITKEVRFSIVSDENDIRQRIARIAKNLGYSTYTTFVKNANSMLVTIPSRVLARAFDQWCGHKAPNKKIPDFLLFHKKIEYLNAFLHGYEIGEGYVGINKLGGSKMYRSCSTTSNILAQQLQLAYARLGIWASISIKNEKTQDVIMGRKVSLHSAYLITYPAHPNNKRTKVQFLNDKILTPIRTISNEIYDGPVCNLETSDNNYLVSNAIVHNCGRWFGSDLELSMHTKLHYLI